MEAVHSGRCEGRVGLIGRFYSPVRVAFSLWRRHFCSDSSSRVDPCRAQAIRSGPGEADLRGRTLSKAKTSTFVRVGLAILSARFCVDLPLRWVAALIVVSLPFGRSVFFLLAVRLMRHKALLFGVYIVCGMVVWSTARGARTQSSLHRCWYAGILRICLIWPLVHLKPLVDRRGRNCCHRRQLLVSFRLGMRSYGEVLRCRRV